MTRRLLLLAFAVPAALLAQDFSGTVVAVTDGDTIQVLHDGTVDRVRLWGIDAPESKQAFGTRAKQFVGDAAFAQEVAVKVRGLDRYKRVLGEVVLPDGRNLNHEIVRAGLAWWYVQFAKHDATLRALEQEARAARRGLWSEAGAVAPWEWRKARDPKRPKVEFA